MPATPLSIVIGTGEGWPHVRPVLEAIRADAEQLGAEILIVDGSGRPAPDAAESGGSVRWLASDSNSVFRMYSEGLRQARGAIVATTEDHAVPRPGWCAAILRAHAEHPEAAAIGGAIENASQGSMVAWAGYFITQGPHMAPLGNREVPMTTNEANVSYKRAAIEELDDNGGLGFMAILHNRRLAERGAILRVDDHMVVDHFEIEGFRDTSVLHFHNGRSVSGFRRERGMTRADWARMAVAPLLPLYRTVRALRVGLGKGRLRRQVLSAPRWRCGWITAARPAT